MAIHTMSGAVTRVELAPAAALFRSLGDPTRLAILRRLALGEARVGELVELTGVQTGDKLVLNPGDKIRDGIAVTAAKK